LQRVRTLAFGGILAAPATATAAYCGVLNLTQNYNMSGHFRGQVNSEADNRLQLE
jgi:hypothetical protein